MMYEQFAACKHMRKVNVIKCMPSDLVYLHCFYLHMQAHRGKPSPANPEVSWKTLIYLTKKKGTVNKLGVKRYHKEAVICHRELTLLQETEVYQI